MVTTLDESWSRPVTFRSPILWCLRSSGYKCDSFFKCSHIVVPLPRVTSLTGLKGSGCRAFFVFFFFFMLWHDQFLPAVMKRLLPHWSDHVEISILQRPQARWEHKNVGFMTWRHSKWWEWASRGWQDTFYRSFCAIHSVCFYFSR